MDVQCVYLLSKKIISNASTNPIGVGVGIGIEIGKLKATAIPDTIATPISTATPIMA